MEETLFHVNPDVSFLSITGVLFVWTNMNGKCIGVIIILISLSVSCFWCECAVLFPHKYKIDSQLTFIKLSKTEQMLAAFLHLREIWNFKSFVISTLLPCYHVTNHSNTKYINNLSASPNCRQSSSKEQRTQLKHQTCFSAICFVKFKIKIVKTLLY